ncbi:hypothetical protein [Candidatus Albibeggiatoa sp. nov. BB20]|uniref:hypothetical protein n=1 Tax=Candidatus Albibeggiatoa sp. nov. BB20 TaxID=3162723 RepID=UPI0033656246
MKSALFQQDKQPQVKNDFMEKTMTTHNDEMLEEYDFSNAVRGKYTERLKSGSNIVKLDDDVAELFPDAQSVNQALRTLGQLIQQHQKVA